MGYYVYCWHTYTGLFVYCWHLNEQFINYWVSREPRISLFTGKKRRVDFFFSICTSLLLPSSKRIKPRIKNHPYIKSTILWPWFHFYDHWKSHLVSKLSNSWRGWSTCWKEIAIFIWFLRLLFKMIRMYRATICVGSHQSFRW
jgi:hypothetical protein